MAKWIEKEVLYLADGEPLIEEWQSARCSACGKYHTTPYMYYFNEYKFCPNCGEKMDGKDTNVHSKSDVPDTNVGEWEQVPLIEVEDEPRKLSNREWKDFLSQQFDISKTSAREMLHGMMRWKKEDNFKRTFNPIKEQDDE
jgi:hypothetical protein